uniref:Uncharacterized protein n=1 Tax=Nelumbo nucifera TaxID=4432 RepID=A0A822ZH21_NELNU|nr:TPA_asm: hypothetical protein HUJ06_000556 [Nelumbo nucifera]
MTLEIESEEVCKLTADSVQWTEDEEETFFSLMVEQVWANNRSTSSFNIEGWKYI